jgi:hypothetical protein
MIGHNFSRILLFLTTFKHFMFISLCTFYGTMYLCMKAVVLRRELDEIGQDWDLTNWVRCFTCLFLLLIPSVFLRYPSE